MPTVEIERETPDYQRLAARFREELETMIHTFEFTYCEECGGDIHEHAFEPGPFGLPFCRCLRPPRED